MKRNATLIWNKDSKEGKPDDKSNKKEKKMPTALSEESFQWISDGI